MRIRHTNSFFTGYLLLLAGGGILFSRVVAAFEIRVEDGMTETQTGQIGDKGDWYKRGKGMLVFDEAQ